MPEESPSTGWRETANLMHAAEPEDQDAATRLMKKYGDRITDWETSSNDILRELARAIRDNADVNAGGQQ